MFKKIDLDQRWPLLEEEILDYWDKEDIFQKCLKSTQHKPRFVFYEGPPTANGKPGIHHVLARIYKDLICRYKTMQGFYVPRKAGWDTHGLPVELEVEKRLQISGKNEIEDFGVANFIEECKKSIFTYKEEWDRNTRRIGYWIDLEHPYITCSNEYIESIWWALKEIYEKGLISKGHKVVPHCPRCQTTLSSHEVAQGYDDQTNDPSIFVKFPLKSKENCYFLAWTTTPWTLTANVALAIHPKELYTRILCDKGELILAKKRLEKVLENQEFEIAEEFYGETLVGQKYLPVFPYGGALVEEKGCRIVAADFVGTEEGTGIVHLAPAFGTDDMEAGIEHDLPVIITVDINGVFKNDIAGFEGLFVKDADKLIIKNLKERNLLFHASTIVHTYPFCWRCSSPLLYLAKDSWFLKTRSIRHLLLEMNEKVDWYPSHIKKGRFGEWLKDAKDWAISRERYWGTPLNIWECSACSHVKVVGSIKELETFSERNLKDLDLHRPYIDEITFSCEKCGQTMQRVKEVLDCWLDSGSMPFAQYHYPFECSDFKTLHYPADFISEGIDQTRGWFFTLLIMNGLLFEESPYRSVLTFELVLDEKGEKMSKSRGNVVNVDEMINQYGTDAIRWSMFFSSTPYVPRKFSKAIVSEGFKNFIMPLLNVCSFFITYANIDRWEPSSFSLEFPRASSMMDRWILSRLEKTIEEVSGSMNQVDITDASKRIAGFIEDLTNWYIRRSRRRFWKSESDSDKEQAYQTLYYTLYRLVLLIAPFVPFVSEYLYQRLCSFLTPSLSESVHMKSYPEANTEGFDAKLDQDMDQIRTWISAGLRARKNAGVKVRYPLASLVVIRREEACITEDMKQIIRDELNVKEIIWEKDLSRYARLILKPNLPVLGKKQGHLLPLIKQALNAHESPFALMAELEQNGKFELNLPGGTHIEIEKEDLLGEVVSADPAWRVESAMRDFIALNLSQDTALIQEGMAREIVHTLQNMRKEAMLEVTDHIQIAFRTDSQEIREVLEKHQKYILAETLSMGIVPLSEEEPHATKTLSLEGNPPMTGKIDLFITRSSS